MKVTAAPKKRTRAVRHAPPAVKAPKWVSCGPAVTLTREEIIASDEAFLEKMKAGSRTSKAAAALVREARK